MQNGQAFEIPAHDGHLIRIEGMPYEGQPQGIFWDGYIEPYIKAIIKSEFKAAELAARQSGSSREVLFSEVGYVAATNIRHVYSLMAAIDRELVTSLRPDEKYQRPVDENVSEMVGLLNVMIRSELSPDQRKDTPSRVFKRYRPVLIAAIIVTVLALGMVFMFVADM